MYINTITGVAEDAANIENTFGKNLGYNIQKCWDNALYQVVNNTEYSVLDMIEFTNPDYPDEPDYFKVIILRSKTGEVFPF